VGFPEAGVGHWLRAFWTLPPRGAHVSEPIMVAGPFVVFSHSLPLMFLVSQFPNLRHCPFSEDLSLKHMELETQPMTTISKRSAEGTWARTQAIIEAIRDCAYASVPHRPLNKRSGVTPLLLTMKA
jgi:hypothetical protein